MMKTKAFTILEALISMILISIITGLIFTLLNLVGKQMSIFSSQVDDELTYNLFNTTLRMDIDKSNDFIASGEDIILKYYDDTIITYSFSKNFIRRNNSFSIDTFNLKSVSSKIISDTNSNNKIIELHLSVLGATIKTNYYLEKDQSHIINNTFYNED